MLLLMFVKLFLYRTMCFASTL